MAGARAVLVGVVCCVAVGGAPPAGAVPDPTLVPIRYDLAGTGLAGYVTYQTDYGQSHATGVPLPWSMQVTGRMTSAAGITPHSVSAQGVGPGTLTCTITVGGRVLSSSTATGNPARVLCENHGQ